MDKTKQKAELISAWSFTIIQYLTSEDMPVIDIGQLTSLLEASLTDTNLVGFNDFLDIYDVPGFVYDSVEQDEELKMMNKKIKSLSLEKQKLLHFISIGHDVENICLSMAYNDPVEYWDKRTDCLIEFKGDNQNLDSHEESSIKHIFAKYTRLRDIFLTITDDISDQSNKNNSKLKWVLSSSSILIFSFIFFIFIYPLLIQKDHQFLFDYGVNKSGFVMTIDSTDLLDEMILDAEEFSPESYWLLALKALQNQNSPECKNNLKSLKHSDKEMFVDRGYYIYRRLKR